MGTIWVKELIGGLDARRLPETSPGGTLIRGEEGHINRGKEFEKRAAFVPTYTLPAAMTTGLSATLTSLYVFGDVAPPAMPSGVAYQRLQHPDGSTGLVRVLSWDLYAGKIYAVGEFADGSRYHFYDGVRVAAWYDGRARAAFVVGGGAGQLDDLEVNGVSIIGAPVAWATSDIATAALIADAVNTHTSVPDYTATVVDAQVNIVAAAAGTASNGLGIVFTVSAGLTTAPSTGLVLSGGTAATAAASASGSFEIVAGTSNPANKITALSINGVDVLGSAVTHTGDNTTTATAVAAQIGSYTSSPDYTATSAGAVVTVTAVDSGAGLNGQAPAETVEGDFAVGNIQAMSGGAAAVGVFVPGTFVKTIGSRVQSVSGPNEHGSGIKAPTAWTTDAIGAYFIDMSLQTSGSEQLKALGEYQNLVAVFAERVVQIWSIDSDPNNNKKAQTLKNTGTSSPKSVTQFGDSDLFYLDESGVRSIRARDASNAAATTDMGTPVDDLITAKLRTLTATERDKVVGLINPIDKRFWLVMKDQIFVFTFFEGSKISAWSIYTPFYYVDGAKTAFTVDDAVVFQRRVHLRGGDKLFVYGGLSTGLTTDETSAVAWLPFLDGNSPTVEKQWTALDAAVRGVWEIRAGMRPTEDGLNVDDVVANISETTYGNPGIAQLGKSTHISLRFASKGPGNAKLSSCAMHYEGAKEDAA